MAGVRRSFFPSFGYQLFLLSLLHLGCLFFSLASTSNQRQPPPPRRRKISPFSQPDPSPSATSQSRRRCSDPGKLKLRPHNNKSSLSLSLSVRIRSCLRQLLSFSGPNPLQQNNQHHLHPAATSPSAVFPTSPEAPPQLRQLRHYLVSPEGASAGAPKTIPPCGTPAESIGVADTRGTAAGSVKRPSFASRADIYPCASCGEVFNKVHLLDLHEATKHAFSELSDGDSGKNIVKIIFQSGWKGGSGRGADEARGGPTVHRILKIHHAPSTLARFEEYREAVRSRAAAGGLDERCAVDGNERLRFYCATFLCGLGRAGNLGTCDSPFCAACGIVRHGFSGKDADGISTHATGWAAHASLPDELEREFAFMHVRRAMLVCRVVAGRVAPGKTVAAGGIGEEEDGGYDSAAAGSQDGGEPWTVEGGLVVFNAWAVLPCFVIVYSCV